ncbi:MAG: hypothetical protein IPF42_11440 [Candidatus Microthrix sp.]|nr:hypothetical protein [Candidatus Microthrix sp.]
MLPAVMPLSEIGFATTIDARSSRSLSAGEYRPVAADPACIMGTFRYREDR